MVRALKGGLHESAHHRAERAIADYLGKLAKDATRVSRTDQERLRQGGLR